MQAPVIDARGLEKAYGVVPVLRGVDLTVERGESVAVLGQNGAGKSTLLRLIACLSRPRAGTLRLFDGECFPARPRTATLARIGYLGHEPIVYQDLTPRENLVHFARLYGLDPRSRGNGSGNDVDLADDRPEVRAARSDQPRGDRDLAALALARVGLGHVADRLTRTLSRGMLQRLALARATLHDPELLLLDEPFVSLDEAASALLERTLGDARSRGVTIVFVTHELARVAALATRAVVLHEGRLCFDGKQPLVNDEFVRFYRSITAPQDHRVGDRP